MATKASVDGWIGEFDKFLDEEFDGGKAYKANKADWLDGKWSGLTLPTGDEAPRATGVPKQKLLDLRSQAHHDPGAASPAQDRRARDRRTAARPSRPARASTGPRARPGLRHPAGRGLSRAPVRPGQRARHLHPAPLGHRSTRRPRKHYTPLGTSAPTRPTSRCSTRRCRKRRCWASSTASR